MNTTQTLDGGGTPGGGHSVAPHTGIVAGVPEAALIPLPDGRIALVDREDVELIEGFPWRSLTGHTGRVYAYARVRGVGYYMHRLIAQTPQGMETDHINGDGLDNRRANLRVATMSQNSANTGKPRRGDGGTHTSRYKGVSWSANRGKWAAYIQVGGLTRNLGGFHSEEEAARAYDTAAAQAWGEFARLNFEGDK